VSHQHIIRAIPCECTGSEAYSNWTLGARRRICVQSTSARLSSAKRNSESKNGKGQIGGDDTSIIAEG
jgi:hypothetical protein